VRNVIFLYAILASASGLEITVWVVPSMIENEVSKLFYRMMQRGD
jgi:hypothetical protein